MIFVDIPSHNKLPSIGNKLFVDISLDHFNDDGNFKLILPLIGNIFYNSNVIIISDVVLTIGLENYIDMLFNSPGNNVIDALLSLAE